MSEMVERVARAICLAELPTDSKWELCVPAARAAIEAMREPTNAMYASANDAFVPASDAAACWHAMIDATLKD